MSARRYRVSVACGNLIVISIHQIDHTWCDEQQQTCSQWQMKVLINHSQTVISCSRSILVKQKDPTLEERSCHNINLRNRKMIQTQPLQLTENGKSVLSAICVTCSSFSLPEILAYLLILYLIPLVGCCWNVVGITSNFSHYDTSILFTYIHQAPTVSKKDVWCVKRMIKCCENCWRLIWEVASSILSHFSVS